MLYASFTAGVIAATWPLVLDPATQLPYHHDPRIFTWVMASIARRLVTSPMTLFHGSAFYPYGDSLAFNEKLIPQALLGLPGFVWGNPVLTYNLLLLTLWPLNGLAMAWVAHRLTRSVAAAWLAGFVFCLSPYFTEYHLNFQMLMAAPLPVVVLAWVRWLETQEPRWLVGAIAGLTLEGLTSWYYAVILSLGLIVLGVGFVCLRWRGWTWKRDLTMLLVGGACAGIVLFPFALPYLTVRRELGFERNLGDTVMHRARLESFVQPGGRSLLYRADHGAETSAFPGFTVFALAAVSLMLLRRDKPMPTSAAWASRIAAWALIASFGALIWATMVPKGRYRVGPLTIRPRIAELLSLAIALGLLLLVIRGWVAWRNGQPRRLSQGDWVRLLLLLAGIFVVLSLGPVIYFRGREVGPGLYGAFYDFFPPLHAVRIVVRFATLSMLAFGLLAALGLQVILERLRGHPRLRQLVLTAAFVALGLEYAVRPIQYDQVAWASRPVDAVIRADRGDVAVLEWPTWVVVPDSDTMLRSLAHGKRVVNGISGFTPDSLHEMSDLLTRRGSSFPVPEAQAALRRIYPLRYLVVRLSDKDFPKDWRETWIGLRRDPPSFLHFRGSFGGDDLYEVLSVPERGTQVERMVSYDFLQAHPLLWAVLRPLGSGAWREQWVDVIVNGRVAAHVALSDRTTATVMLPGPFHLAAPNVITLSYGYVPREGALDERYRIGATGTLSPADIRVVSGGLPYGDVASILVNGVERAPNRRGYNLVALGRPGESLGEAVFDTFVDPEAARRLAAWVAALPQGTVVIGGVRDEGSALLTEEGVRALGMLGAKDDLRGRFRVSHAFVGVKGAPPGSAIEAIGPKPVEISVGRSGEGGGFELVDFTLSSAASFP
jgi:hypothetical protein